LKIAGLKDLEMKKVSGVRLPDYSALSWIERQKALFRRELSDLFYTPKNKKIHTHPYTEGYAALHTYTEDIFDFLKDNSMKYSVVAQLDPKNRELIGYTILRKTDKTQILPLDTS
jgi:hypothetical protein